MVQLLKIFIHFITQFSMKAMVKLSSKESISSNTYDKNQYISVFIEIDGYFCNIYLYLYLYTYLEQGSLRNVMGKQLPWASAIGRDGISSKVAYKLVLRSSNWLSRFIEIEKWIWSKFYDIIHVLIIWNSDSELILYASYTN